MRALSADERASLAAFSGEPTMNRGDRPTLEGLVGRGCVRFERVADTTEYGFGGPADAFIITDLGRLALRVAVALPAVRP